MSSLAQPCFDIPNLAASVFHHVHSSHVCYEVPTLSNVSCQNTSTLISKLTMTVRVVWKHSCTRMRRSQFSKSGYVSAGISLTSLQHLPEDPIQSPTIQNTLKRQRKIQYAQLHMDSSATSPSAAHQLESSPCKQTQIQRPILCRACFEIHNLLCVHIQSKSSKDRLAKGIRCRYSWK
jgi:hypothetical protein